MFEISRLYLYFGFCPDPKHFIVNFEQNSVKYAEKWGWGGGSEQCNIYINYFNNKKINNNNANRPYLVFPELKHANIDFGLSKCLVENFADQASVTPLG